MTTNQSIEISRIISETLCEECSAQKRTLINICDNCYKKIIEKILCKTCQSISPEQILWLIEQNKKIMAKKPLNVIHKEEQTLIEILKHIRQCPACQEKFNPSFISQFLSHPAMRSTTAISALLILFITLFPMR